jgi:transcription elongation factor Elf1
VRKQVDGDDPLGQEGVAGEGVGRRARQGDEVFCGGLCVAADVDEALEAGGHPQGLAWGVSFVKHLNSIAPTVFCLEGFKYKISQCTVKMTLNLATLACTAFGWSPARGGSTTATMESDVVPARFNMSGRRNSARPGKQVEWQLIEKQFAQGGQL